MRRVSFLPAVLVGLLLALLTAVPVEAATTTARSLLAQFPAVAEGGSTTYSRSYFKHWVDADKDSCDTREEILIAESTVSVRLGAGCKVLSGKWVSWYDGVSWTNPSDVDIDHVVALKEAWESGARSWTVTNRERFANDLAHPWSLDGVTDNVNSSKSDRDPANWLPPVAARHCDYAIHWISVKYRWRLSIDATEKAKLSSLLSGSCGARTVTIPKRAL